MFHPFFVQRTKLLARLGLRRKGCTSQQIEDVLNDYNHDTIIAAAAIENISIPVFDTEVGVIGDGTIWHKIVDWIKSPEGQALIAAIIKMLFILITMMI